MCPHASHTLRFVLTPHLLKSKPSSYPSFFKICPHTKIFIFTPLLWCCTLKQYKDTKSQLRDFTGHWPRRRCELLARDCTQSAGLRRDHRKSHNWQVKECYRRPATPRLPFWCARTSHDDYFPKQYFFFSFISQTALFLCPSSPSTILFLLHIVRNYMNFLIFN